MKLQKNCYDALEAIEYLNSNSVDLIFLDLNMPLLKGFEFLRTLTNPPKVIVTTAYQEHALEGYELNIVDYLLKPFSFERFLKAVNKATKNHEQPTPNKKLESKEKSKTIFLRENKRYSQVEVENILYLEASGNYTKVFLKDQKITVREKISDLMQSVNDEDFIQVHKSFVVAKKHIDVIEGNVIQIGQHEIPVGNYYKSNVRDLL
jgi:DNA-binding LytR/AlgR family response regulator